MTEIAPVCFQNVSQLIVATSHTAYYEQNVSNTYKPVVALQMISNLIVQNIELFAKEVKQQSEKMDQDNQAGSFIACVTAYEDFTKFLLQNSFSFDHNCRYESQKILHCLASKFFKIVSENHPEKVSEWIWKLINDCNFIVNKRIDDSQLDVLKDPDYANTQEQSNIINHLTAQLQGINWLVADMEVELGQLINNDLLFNIIEGIKMLGIRTEDQVSKVDQKMHRLLEDMSRKVIKSQYLKQLLMLLTHCSASEEFYEKYVEEAERQTNFNFYALAIQALLIPHSLSLDFSNEEEDDSLEDIMVAAKQLILVLTNDRGKRLLRGIKDVKDTHEYIDLSCLDPEIPEEYSAKIILRLTQGYLSLVDIEKLTAKNEIKNLICEKWSTDYLIPCTEVWVGHDSSPVINLKGKILLNFLCQLYIPTDKVCSWLTEKSTDFQKGIDSI